TGKDGVMNRLLLPRVVMLALLAGCILSAQQQQKADSKSKETPDQKIDPLALKVLKAATDRIHNAKAYSFHTIASRENLGTNGQIITQFNKSEFIVQQPDKLRINVRGRGRDVQLLYDAGKTTLFTPDTHLYTSFQASATLDAALHGLEEREIFLPTS